MKNQKLYQAIATAAGAYHRCVEKGNEFGTNWKAYLNKLEKALPSGSGIDCGTKIDLDATNDDRIVLTLSFHHMDENGMYDGWTEHVVTVTPAFTGFNLKISGKNRNDIKEYLHDVYSFALDEVAPEMTIENKA